VAISRDFDLSIRQVGLFVLLHSRWTCGAYMLTSCLLLRIIPAVAYGHELEDMEMLPSCHMPLPLYFILPEITYVYLLLHR
jgi:hypothetical protein